MNNIKFTAAYDYKTQQKIQIYSELDKIFENIDISKFGNSIQRLGIVFQALEPQPNIVVKEYKSLKRKTNTLELYLVLDYDHIMQGSDSENLTYIKEVFLKGCETFLKPLMDFDYQGFVQELQRLIAV